MSRVRRCDRCGCVYDPYTNDFNSIGTTTFNINNEQVQMDDYIDVCPACKDEFKQWLDAKKPKSTIAPGIIAAMCKGE